MRKKQFKPDNRTIKLGDYELKEHNGYVLLPKELLPYIKICKLPKTVREYKAEQQRKFYKMRKKRKL